MNNAPILRPMGMPELLDQAIRLYRQHFLKFIGIIAIPFIPLILIQGVFSYISTSSAARPGVDFNPISLVSIGGTILVSIVQFFLVQGVATAAMTRSIADVYIGKSFDILGAYSNLKGSWGRLIIALLMMFVIIFLALIWFIIPCVGWVTGIGLIVFLGASVSPLVAPIIVLEQEGVFSSIRRAWDLARLRFWWLVGYSLVINLLGQLIVTGPVFIVSALLQALFTSLNLSIDQTLIWTTIAQTLTGMVSNLLFNPLKLLAITVAYLDLRVRYEGLDLQVQTHSEESATDVFVPQNAPSAPMPFLTWVDTGYFTLLSIAAAALYAVFGPVLMIIALILIGMNLPQ